MPHVGSTLALETQKSSGFFVLFLKCIKGGCIGKAAKGCWTHPSIEKKLFLKFKSCIIFNNFDCCWLRQKTPADRNLSETDTRCSVNSTSLYQQKTIRGTSQWCLRGGKEILDGIRGSMFFSNILYTGENKNWNIWQKADSDSSSIYTGIIVACEKDIAFLDKLPLRPLEAPCCETCISIFIVSKLTMICLLCADHLILNYVAMLQALRKHCQCADIKRDLAIWLLRDRALCYHAISTFQSFFKEIFSVFFTFNLVFYVLPNRSHTTQTHTVHAHTITHKCMKLEVCVCVCFHALVYMWVWVYGWCVIYSGG